MQGFKRTVMGDYMGTRSYFGSCCGCGAQFMSTHEVVYVPTTEVRTANDYQHGPACEHCARKAIERAEKQADAARGFGCAS